MAFNTGNPLGSSDPRDLYDNAENLDELVNSESKDSHPDRLGKGRKSWHGMESEFNADQTRREDEFQDAQDDKAQRFDALLAASGYEYLDDYAAGIEITEYNQVVRDSAGEFWRLSGSTSLPYTTDGSGLPESGAFVSVGDAALRNDLAGEPANGAGALRVRGAVIYVDTIADLQALPTSGLVDGQAVNVGGGLFKWGGTSFVPIGYIPVTAWAAGDGVTDDSAAIVEALESGYKLDWQDKTYSISSQIGSLSTTLASLDWVSSGAVVSMDGGAHIEAMFIYSASVDFQGVLKGSGLTLNGNSLCNTGFYLRQSSTERTATAVMEGLSVKNLRRDPAFATSDGIRFSGGFYNVTLKKPRVENMALPTDAGTFGVVGVHGITISRSGDAYPESSNIADPYIKDIFSEDETYPHDQDGMRLFSATDDAGRGVTRHFVAGGYFENCWGRDIKVQAHSAHIDGIRIKHTTGPSVGMDHPVIDFQRGGGTVSRMTAEFDGATPPAVVNFGSSGAGVEVTSSLKDSFVHIISGEIPTVLRAWTANESSGNGQIKMDNVRIKGAVTTPLNVLTPDDKASATLVNVQCDNITDALATVRSSGGSGPYLCDFTFVKCINTGAPVPTSRSRISGSSADAVVSQLDCVGFSAGPGRANPTDGDKSGLQRTSNMIGQYDTGGILRLDAVTLSDGIAHTFPPTGYSSGVQMAMVSMNRSANEQGFFAYDSAGADILAAGVNVEAGATSDPGAGFLRAWVDSVTGGLVVSNNSGSKRTITVMFFG